MVWKATNSSLITSESEAEASDLLVGQARSGINKRLGVSLNRIDSHRNGKGFEIIAANLHAIAGLVGGQLAPGDPCAQSRVRAEAFGSGLLKGEVVRPLGRRGVGSYEESPDTTKYPEGDAFPACHWAAYAVLIVALPGCYPGTQPLLLPGLPFRGVTQLHFVGGSTGCSPFGVLHRGGTSQVPIHPRGDPLPSGSRDARRRRSGVQI